MRAGARGTDSQRCTVAGTLGVAPLAGVAVGVVLALDELACVGKSQVVASAAVSGWQGRGLGEHESGAASPTLALPMKQVQVFEKRPPPAG